jgi:hypothetical protein
MAIKKAPMQIKGHKKLDSGKRIGRTTTLMVPFRTLKKIL